jgi:hypothetical protein
VARVSSLNVAPSAARLTGSLRDIGYDFPTAIADLVDNSVAAGATRVNVETQFVPHDSYVLISDDGAGMTEDGLLEALRFGSRRTYSRNELGRFGLGLKTGTFSQCRRLTVVTRHSAKQRRIYVRTLDLNTIERLDQWVVSVDETSPAIERAVSILEEGPGTVIVWEDLDRILPERYAESGWGRRRLASLAKKTAQHLSMVFHRFIEGVSGRSEFILSVNGEKLTAWDPFARSEPHTQELTEQLFEIETSEGSADVRFRGYVLPPRDRFSTQDEFERLSGPMKWNRQQGLYIYRANRLVQFGGWNGVRGIDEHTKLARASVDFDTDLDESFQINVAKMRVSLPPGLKHMLERPIHELCVTADDAYRQAANKSDKKKTQKLGSSESVALGEVGIALKAALMEESTDLQGFRAAMETLKRRHPELAKGLGL